MEVTTVRKRVTLAGAGVVATVVGVAAVFAPGIADSIPFPDLPVVVVGGLAGVFALLVGLRRRDSTIRGAELPEVEAAAEDPIPGSVFDEQLRGAAGIGVDAARNRRVGRRHLADVAIAVLAKTEGYSESEAEAALAAGTWTDDPIAASCFAEDPAPLGIRGSVIQYLNRRSRYERELVHTVDVLQAKLEEGHS